MSSFFYMSRKESNVLPITIHWYVTQPTGRRIFVLIALVIWLADILQTFGSREHFDFVRLPKDVCIPVEHRASNTLRQRCTITRITVLSDIKSTWDILVQVNQTKKAFKLRDTFREVSIRDSRRMNLSK